MVTKGMYTYTLKVTRHLGHFFLSYYRFKIGVYVIVHIISTVILRIGCALKYNYYKKKPKYNYIMFNN